MPGNKGIQMASAVLARSTVQTAIVLASGLGCAEQSRRTRGTLQQAAADMMLGALQFGVLHPNIVALDVENTKRRKAFTTRFDAWHVAHSPLVAGLKDDWSCKTENRNFADSLKVDLVLTPLDGAEVLRRGRSGSVSAAAAGSKDSFSLRDDPAYFVIAVGPERVEAVSSILSAYESYSLPTDEPLLVNFVGGAFQLINELVAASGDVVPVVGITLGGAYEEWDPSIKHWHRRRRLEGSALAAALAAYEGKVPYSIFVSRPPQVMQAALAAQGLGGRLFALPLSMPVKKSDYKKVKVKRQSDETVESGITVPSTKILRETDFVRADANAVLCVSSVSEVCVYDRVRFGFDNTAECHTIIISLSTGKITRQHDKLKLETANMRDPEGGEINAKLLLQAFRDFLQVDDDDPSLAQEIKNLKQRMVQ